MIVKIAIDADKISIGQVFTPEYIAEFMVKNAACFLESNARAKDNNFNPKSIRVLEPSVGEGVFLKYLLNQNFHDITAYEIDRSLKEFLLLNYPKVHFKFENFLGSDVDEKYDLIIGNPPYLGQNYYSKIFQEYLQNYPICEKFFVGHMDLFYYFIHLGLLKLNPGGILTYITSNYWITKSKKTSVTLLKPHVLNDSFLLQYIDLSNLKVFKDIGQQNCIFILQKKTENDKTQRENKEIEVIQVEGKNRLADVNNTFNQKIFSEIQNLQNSTLIKRYTSALTNNDLTSESSWNIMIPKEVKKVVDKVEQQCILNGKPLLLKDYFMVRNGIIFIKDQIFTFNNGNDLKIESNNFFIKIAEEFVKVSNHESFRLKKLYKGKSIRPYGFQETEFKYAVYFNKNEFKSDDLEERNKWFEAKYPVLTAYLKQYKKELKEILINAKENPLDFYFPRRGAFVRKDSESVNNSEILDLEPYYDGRKKILFRYISNVNVFGYAEAPYFATSDTYFLWPAVSEAEIDYDFLLAYFNSNLVQFLFKAKNISLKRSKTKLEFDLVVPNLNSFQTDEQKQNISFIKFLMKSLIRNVVADIDETDLQIIEKRMKKSVISALKNRNIPFIQKIIDDLIFELFGLNGSTINVLMEKYYLF